MRINIHEAKTHLSRLVEEAAKGEPFIIAKAGKPMVKITSLNSPAQTRARRLGFLEGKAIIPEDFDTMGGVRRR
jgi:prevent-host-death family protein